MKLAQIEKILKKYNNMMINRKINEVLGKIRKYSKNGSICQQLRPLPKNNIRLNSIAWVVWLSEWWSPTIINNNHSILLFSCKRINPLMFNSLIASLNLRRKFSWKCAVSNNAKQLQATNYQVVA